MTDKTPAPFYFEVLKSLHKGGMSLWLNRRTLMPMMVLPTVVTFMILTIAQSGALGDRLSPFQLALIQLPSDFITGLFCALIIVIIMNAPKKEERSGPMMFSLNIMEKRSLMIKGAIAHMIIAYLASGLYGGLQGLVEPMKASAEAEAPRGDLMLIVIVGAVASFYAIRAFLLPIFFVADMDATDFYKRHKGFGLSVPIFMIKMLTTIGGMVVFLLPLSVIVSAAQGQEGGAGMVVQMLTDLVMAFASVVITAWGYASLSIGVRQMMEGNKQ